ncbi:unnamed protein product, partial [Oppiella nova]
MDSKAYKKASTVNTGGSDCSDRSTPSPTRESSPHQSLKEITRRVVSDHDYDRREQTIESSILSSVDKTAINSQSFSQFFSTFDPLMECMDTQLFGGELHAMDGSTISSAYDDEYANAPTPYMGPFDLNEIDIQDLINTTATTSSGCFSLDDNNNALLDLNGIIFSDNEVTIGADVPLATVATAATVKRVVVKHEANDYETKKAVNELKRAARKRHISAETYAYDESDDSGSDDESFVAPNEPKGKAKVGRKPSKGGNKCMSRNAIAARENREKKKRENEEMRRRMNAMSAELKETKALYERANHDIQELRNENRYLRGVIENDSAIGALIKHISGTPKLEFVGTHFVGEAPGHYGKGGGDKSPGILGAAVDDKSLRKSTRIAQKVESSGICLHVNNNRMSVELCH